MTSPIGKFALNVFEGSAAIRDFLNPENSPPLPLVELPVEFNHTAPRVFASLQS